MRIEDLQIGDIIFNSNKVPVVFNGMGCEGIMGSTDRYCELIDKRRLKEYNEHFEKLSPIPLTKEILEKNGFSDYNGRMRKVWNNGYFIYANNVFDFNVEIDVLNDNAEYLHIRCSHIGILGMPIKHVHELQNAARLCGLYEMADEIKA